MLDSLLSKVDTNENETPKRETWGSNIEYYLGSIGFAVGFGSLWRFPYVVYANGGGVFLIPYTIFVVVLAFPLFYLESALGQMYQKSSPGCFEKAGKKYRGVGIAQIITSFSLGAFYNVLMAYSLIFLWESFTWELPWTKESSVDGKPTVGDASYFYDEVLQNTSSISELGGFNNSVLVASIVSFIIVYLCVAKGVKTSGKVVYVSTPLPYILMFILLIRGLFLEGAMDGISYLFAVDWSKLWEFEVWYRAANQVLFQYGIALASLHTLASYKERHQSILHPSLFVPIVTALTGILCGLTVFAYMGHMAAVSNVHISQLPLQGPDLVFVAYPAALSLMPAPTFWAILFFVMLYFLGIDTEFCFLETVGGFIEDEKIKIFGRLFKIEVMRVFMTLAFFVVGVFLYTKAGFYFLTLYDDYITVVPMTLTATLECLIFGWLVGFDDLKNLIKRHAGEDVPQYVVVCVKYVALPVLVVILIGSFYKMMLVNLFNYPWWAAIFAACLTGIPIYAIWYYYKNGNKTAAACGSIYNESEKTLIELEEISISKHT